MTVARREGENREGENREQGGNPPKNIRVAPLSGLPYPDPYPVWGSVQDPHLPRRRATVPGFANRATNASGAGEKADTPPTCRNRDRLGIPGSLTETPQTVAGANISSPEISLFCPTRSGRGRSWGAAAGAGPCRRLESSG